MTGKDAVKYIESHERERPGSGYFVCCIDLSDVAESLSGDGMDKFNSTVSAVGDSGTVLSVLADALYVVFEDSGALSRMLCSELQASGYELSSGNAGLSLEVVP